ncbi:MAG: response regulator transcription factor [Saprospiraceae bacterium]|nr:response regulator transcription factor [Saprospiraceae bacterium]
MHQQLITTVIADDYPIFAEGLQSVLSNHPHLKFAISGYTSNLSNLTDVLLRTNPKLLILDLNLFPSDEHSVTTIAKIKLEFPNIRILTLSNYNDPRVVKSVMKAGTDGFILKNSTSIDLCTATEKIIKGETYLGNGVLLRSSFSDNEPIPNRPDEKFMLRHNLTKREVEVLKLLTKALNSKQIANQLFISDQTVGVHRKNIMRKMGVSNTASLIRMAYDNRLV